MANPVFLYENPLELATLTAFNFAEDTANPLARQIDRDPTRLTLVGAAAGPTWNTSVELRFLLPTGGMPFTATHLYVPAGHNLNLADTIELESSIFGFGTSPQQNLNAVAVSAGALMLTLDITLTGAARRWIWLTINDADRATSQVVYQLGELFVSRQIQVASAIGIDPEWEHDRVPNLRVTESDTGLPRVVKRGEIRRTMRYRWKQISPRDIVKQDFGDAFDTVEKVGLGRLVMTDDFDRMLVWKKFGRIVLVVDRKKRRPARREKSRGA